jgi:repressor LexA
MRAEPLSPKQQEVLSAIRRRVQDGDPVPTYRELGDEFGWNSTGTVRDHLKALAGKGHIELSGKGHRRIRLVNQIAVTGVPLIGRVAAGSPVIAEENVERRIPVPADWTGSGTYFALRVDGDSMIDAGIREGDCVIIRQQDVANDGEIVVATLDGQTTLKRLQRRGDRVTLVPENSRYRPIPVQTDSSIVQGVVVGLLRAYQRRGALRWASQRVDTNRAKTKESSSQVRGGLKTRARNT